jgi:hypothetical protein
MVNPDDPNAFGRGGHSDPAGANAKLDDGPADLACPRDVEGDVLDNVLYPGVVKAGDRVIGPPY